MSLVKLTAGMTDQEERAIQNSNNAYLSTAMPIGTSLAFRGSVAPLGTLFCDGSAVSRTTYAALFDAISMLKTVTSMVSGSNGLSVSNAAGLFVGEYLEGVGLPANTMIQNINGTTIGINNAATVSRTSGTIRALPFGHGDGSTTFNVPNESMTINGVVYRNIIVAVGGVSQATIDLALNTLQPLISPAMDISLHSLTATANISATGTIKQNGKIVATTDDIGAVNTALAGKQPTITPGTDITLRDVVARNINAQYISSDGEINGQTMRRGAIDLVDTDQLAAAVAPIKSVNGPIKSDGSGNFSKATAADMGLGNVTNTADADKPISHPQARALQPRLAGTATGDPVATITDAATGAEFSAVIAKGRTTVTGTPSPDAPATISGVSPTQIAVSGQNLSAVPNQKVQFSNSYLVDYQPTAPKVKLLPSTKYTIAFDYNVNSASSSVFLGIGYGSTAYQVDIVSSSVYPTQTTGRKVLTFTTPTTFTQDPYLWIRFARLGSVGSLNVDISNVIIAIGEYATLPYVPYTGQTIALSPSAPMYDHDTYDARTGTENHYDVVLTMDGVTVGKKFSSTDYYKAQGYNYAYIYLPNIISSPPTCSHAGTISATQVSAMMGAWVSTVLGLSLPDTITGIVSTDTKDQIVSKINAWLSAQATAGTPVSFIYQVSVPVTYQHAPVDIPQPSLIANITADGAPVSVDYTRDLALTLETKANKGAPVWITPTILNGYGTTSPVRYDKDDFGFVHVKGSITTGTTGQVGFQFAAGYRPLETQTYSKCYVTNAGNLVVYALGTVADVCFLAEQ